MNRSVSIILPYYNRKKLLEITLDSFEHFYSTVPQLEIVIVDDGSNDENRVVELIKKYSLNIQLVRLTEKTGVNPCYPYNVGVRRSVGDIIVLTSPETFHTTNMFDISNNFKKLTDKTYFQFSVFCLVADVQKIEKEKLCRGLGKRDYPYSNDCGSWYVHSKIRPSYLNFFSALTRNTYYDLSGFDERFRYGTGFDDEEFKIRVLEIVDEVIWFDDALAIHKNHEVVNNSAPTTNQGIFSATRRDTYKFNDDWGRL